MIRHVTISYAGMRIAGTVETPDERRVRYFHRSDAYRSVLALRTKEPTSIFLLEPDWAEIKPGTHVSEAAT